MMMRRRWTLRWAGAVALVALGALTGCGGNDSSGSVPSSSTTTVADVAEPNLTPSTTSELGGPDPDEIPTVAAPVGTPANDEVTPFADEPAGEIDLSEVEPPEPEFSADEQVPVNEAGVPITLDEPATLVCARAEFARDAAAAGDDAGVIEHLAEAAALATTTAVPELSSLAAQLGSASADRAAELAAEVLEICAGAGHQI